MRGNILDDVSLDLTTLEFAILASILKSKGRVKSREHLIEEVSERRFDAFDRSIDVHVSSFRKKLGEAVWEEIADVVPNQWNQAIKPLADEKNVTAVIFDPDFPDQLHFEIPENIIQRARITLPPKRAPGPAGPSPQGRRGAQPEGARPHESLPHEGRNPQVDGPSRFAPDSSRAQPQSHPFERVPLPRPVFLMRSDGGCGYWAGVHLVLPTGIGQPARHHLLLIRSERLDGSGMFFDFKPWLWGGLAALALSLLFWTPFILGITRYLGRFTTATDCIAPGKFEVSLPPRGNDELSRLGHAIQTMAVRLDHLTPAKNDSSEMPRMNSANLCPEFAPVSVSSK